MNSRLRDASLTFTNVIGCSIYLWLASHGWRIAAEHGEIPITGEPFVWADCLPVLALFVVVNLIWAGLLVRRKETRGGAFWLAIATLWTTTIYFDFAHH